MTPRPYRLPKVRIVGLVQPRTLASLKAWRKAYGIPIGVAIDEIFNHAMRGEGAFIFKLPITGKHLPDNSEKRHETTLL